MKYYRKLIVSGVNYELNEYQCSRFFTPWGKADRESWKKFRGLSDGGFWMDEKERTLEDKISDRLRNLEQTRKKVRRIINANRTTDDAFLTLTFARNVQDIKQANYEWKKFRQRFEYDTGKKLRYVVVIEFQERGAVHYHAYLFGVGFVNWPVYLAAWGNGDIQINHVKDPDKTAAYVTSYMVKDIATDARLMGQKCYMCSRGLNKPVEYDNYETEGFDALAAELIKSSRIDYYKEEIMSSFLGPYRKTLGVITT
ncbi:MAG: hypothetical protein VB085_13645 [Peptococcaceae bacterium]|nr:hypothetical protein [Peptococcaceae bacterium]